MHLEQGDSFPSPAEFKQTAVGTPANKLAQFGTNHCPAWEVILLNTESGKKTVPI